MRRAFIAAVVLACGAAHAQSISPQSAEAAGQANDVATLERIVASGDPKLVPYFGTGMRRANPYVMAPQVEAVVVKHFDHPTMGAALRALPGRYATRALFDLQLARARDAYRSDDPSFEQILQTEQPGIEEALLALASHWPARTGQPPGVASYLGRRKHPGVVPYLLASIEAGYTPPYNTQLYNHAFDLLLAYPSEEVWRKAAAEIDRLRGEGKVRDDQYAHAREKVDRLLKDPKSVLARMQAADAYAEFVRRRDAIFPSASQVREIQKRSPREYVEAQARYIEQVEKLAAQSEAEHARAEPGHMWASLGIYARFQVKDATLAVPYLQRAAKARNPIGQLVLADTYQFALKDKGAAARAYESARDSALPYAAPGTPMNDFWKAWLAAEIEFLRTGKRFSGRVPESVIAGYWEATGIWMLSAMHTFPEFPVTDPRVSIARAPMPSRAIIASATPASGWKPTEYALGRIDRASLPQRLQAIPPSRFALLVTLREVSALPDAEAILRELARSDPSGFWTTVILGTVAYHESTPARRDEALANGVAEVLPGMAAPGKPNPLADAARRHMQVLGLRALAADGSAARSR